MQTVPALWNVMKFPHLLKFKFHEQCTIYWDQHLKPVCEIWAYSEKLNNFMKKVDSARTPSLEISRTVPALEISWNFNIFQNSPNFIKLIYLNHHQKRACEIWAHSEKLTYFIEKCWQCMKFQHFFKNSKWVWSGNTTITNCRPPRGTARKSRSTITRHQEDKLSKAISSLFPIKMIAILEWT